LNPFTYTFSKGERIGIIGKNGVGKSTFLKILTGEIKADSGRLETGETIIFGHYRQQGLEFEDTKRVIDVVKDVAEFIKLSDENSISAYKFLEFFLLPPEMQYTQIEKLSGGEKRRLGLMMVLLKNPNFLILDEPTNDLDLITMNKLEEFLLDFGGCLILVSHDRFFMDKLVEHYFIFEGEGKIKDFNGTYTEYREMLNEKAEIEQKQKPVQQVSQVKTVEKEEASPVKKLTFAEQKEYTKLEKEIQKLEDEKAVLEAKLSAGKVSLDEITEASVRIGEILELIDEKSMRWLELAERI